MHAILLSEAIEAVKAGGTDFLSADFQLTRDDSVARVTITNFAAPATFVLVPSTGSAVGLATIAADVVKVFDVPLDKGRTWNVQTLGAAAATIRVQELSRVT